MSGVNLARRPGVGPAGMAPPVSGSSSTGGMRHRGLGLVPESAHYEALSTWTLLRPGDFVEIRRGAAFVRSGWVDDLMADGTAVWIIADDFGRVLFHASDEVDVWRRCLRS